MELMQSPTSFARTTRRSSAPRGLAALALALAGGAWGVGCGGDVDFTVADASTDAIGDTSSDAIGDTGGDSSASCPSVQPSSGAACVDEGLLCKFPSGCPTPNEAKCVGGKWAIAYSDCPAPVPYCPATTPTSGSACSSLGLVCAYGDDPRPQCRTSVTCTGGGWQVALTGCPPVPTTTCPATAAAAEGQTCAKEGAFCSYSGGTVTCGCSACAGGPCGTVATWHCAYPPTDARCPTTLPNLGTACTTGGLSCDYGSCSAGTIAGRKCQSGRWIDVPMACPA